MAGQKKYEGTHILDLSGGGCCFLERASSKQGNENRSPPPPFRQGLDLQRLLRSTEIPNPLQGKLQAHKWSRDGKMMLRLYILPQLFTAWCNLKALSLNSCEIAAACFCCWRTNDGAWSKPSWSQQRKRQLLLLFQGFSRKSSFSLLEFLSYATSFVYKFAHCNSFLNLWELEQVTAR